MKSLFGNLPKKTLIAAILGAILVLSGCSGGSDNSYVGPSNDAVVPPSPDNGGTTPPVVSAGTLSGVAGKGPLMKAKVTAYCGKKSDNDILGRDGSTGNGMLGTLLKKKGAYSISLSKICLKPVEIVVEAIAGTTMLDEIKGEISVPIGLKMRAFVPNVGSKTTKHITPLTDMAAALVEKSTAALSIDLVNSAEIAIIYTVLGGNPAVYRAEPKPVTDYATASTEEKQLITLLTALSAAATNATGVTPGDKIQTVLTDLATRATNTITDVTASTYTVGINFTNEAYAKSFSPLKMINDGLDALKAKTIVSTSSADAIAADVDSIKIAITGPALNLTQQYAESNAPTQVFTGNLTGISAAMKLFTTLRSNGMSLHNGSATGFLQTKSQAMSDDFVKTKDIANDVKSTFSLFFRATDFVDDVANKASNLGQLQTDKVNGNYYTRQGNGQADDPNCIYYTTNGTSQQLSGRASCVFQMGDMTSTQTSYSNTYIYLQVWRASFLGIPTANYNYSSYTKTTECKSDASGCTTVTSNAPQTGTFTTVHDTKGSLTSMTITKGKFVPLIVGATDSTLNLKTSRTTLNDTDTVDISGSSIASGVVTVTAGPGSSIISTSSTGEKTGKIIGQIKTSVFQYDGTLDLSAVKDNAGKATFTGKISTLSSSGVASEFFNGSMTAEVFAKVDPSQPLSIKNYNIGTVSLSGKVTNSGDLSTISDTLERKTYGQEDVKFTYVFGGSYSLTASGTNYDDSSKPDSLTITATDGTKIVLTRDASGTKGSVKDSNGAEIGTILPGADHVDFIDGTFILI